MLRSYFYKASQGSVLPAHLRKACNALPEMPFPPRAAVPAAPGPEPTADGLRSHPWCSGHHHQIINTNKTWLHVILFCHCHTVGSNGECIFLVKAAGWNTVLHKSLNIFLILFTRELSHSISSSFFYYLIYPNGRQGQRDWPWLLENNLLVLTREVLASLRVLFSTNVVAFIFQRKTVTDAQSSPYLLSKTFYLWRKSCVMSGPCHWILLSSFLSF